MVFSGMNDSIAVVVLDAVRSDFFEQEFNWIPGQHYKQVYSTSHWTIPAHASLFTGLIPRETGTYAGSPSFFPPETPLAKQLQKIGYTTRLYTANIQLVQWDGWTQGFDDVVGPEVEDEEYIFDWNDAIYNSILPGPLKYPELAIRCIQSEYPTIPSLKKGFKMKFGETGKITTEGIFNMFRNINLTDEEFVFFNLMDVHSSSGKNTGEAIAEGVSDADKLIQSYHNSVKVLSEDYRQLFNYLYDRFDWVITLSDHGELLGEYGLSGHGYGLYPELVQIPLVISSQDDTCSYPTDDLVSLLDIPSTIRDISAIDDYGRGESLLNTETRQKAPAERLGQPHLHERMFKTHKILDEFERYDTPLRGLAINNNGYAYETMSTPESTEEWKKDEQVEINRFFEEINVFRSKNGDMTVSSSVQKRLEELGYA
jgi:arylsulfatase